MGEQADMMINGDVCDGCGEFFEESLGYPGKCERCLRAAGEWDEDLGSSRRVIGGGRTKEDREVNRRLALHHFVEAKQLAESKGLILKRFSDQHYQLTDGQWVQNIYPGNQRLWFDRNHKKPPFLKLPAPWTLLDVVRASRP